MDVSRLAKSLFPTVEAEFFSLYSLPESTVRLRAAADQASIFKQTMHGEFQGTTVVLSRVIPFVGNGYAPVFTGSFRGDGDRVVLGGQFGVKRWFAVYQCSGLAFVVFLGAVSSLAVFLQPRTAWWIPFAFVGLLALHVGQIRLWQWFSRNDVAWISRRIGRTLGRSEDWPDPPPRLPGRWWQRWQEAAGQ